MRIGSKNLGGLGRGCGWQPGPAVRSAGRTCRTHTDSMERCGSDDVYTIRHHRGAPTGDVDDRPYSWPIRPPRANLRRWLDNALRGRGEI